MSFMHFTLDVDNDGVALVTWNSPGRSMNVLDAAVLNELAARVGTASNEHEYGDKLAVWLENGRKVLDYMEADERVGAASFKDSMEEQGIAVNSNDLITLTENMRSLSKPWRRSIGKPEPRSKQSSLDRVTIHRSPAVMAGLRCGRG